MLKNLKTCLLVASALVSTAGWAIEPNRPSQDFNFQIRVDLPPNIPKLQYNPTGWKLTANCVVSTEDEFNDLEVLGVAQESSVNGIPISKGTNFHMNVQNNEVLNVVAGPGAQVQLTNYGPHMVKAVCTLVKKD